MEKLFAYVGTYTHDRNEKYDTTFSIWNVIDDLEQLPLKYYIGRYVMKHKDFECKTLGLLYCPIEYLSYKKCNIKTNMVFVKQHTYSSNNMENIIPTTKEIHIPYLTKDIRQYILNTYNIEICKLFDCSFLSLKSLQKFLKTFKRDYYNTDQTQIIDFKFWLQILIEYGVLSVEEMLHYIYKHDCEMYFHPYYFKTLNRTCTYSLINEHFDSRNIKQPYSLINEHFDSSYITQPKIWTDDKIKVELSENNMSCVIDWLNRLEALVQKR